MTLLMSGITETLAPLHNKIYRIIAESSKPHRSPTKEHTFAALS